MSLFRSVFNTIIALMVIFLSNTYDMSQQNVGCVVIAPAVNPKNRFDDYDTGDYEIDSNAKPDFKEISKDPNVLFDQLNRGGPYSNINFDFGVSNDENVENQDPKKIFDELNRLESKPKSYERLRVHGIYPWLESDSANPLTRPLLASAQSNDVTSRDNGQFINLWNFRDAIENASAVAQKQELKKIGDNTKKVGSSKTIFTSGDARTKTYPKIFQLSLNEAGNVQHKGTSKTDKTDGKDYAYHSGNHEVKHFGHHDSYHSHGSHNHTAGNHANTNGSNTSKKLHYNLKNKYPFHSGTIVIKYNNGTASAGGSLSLPKKKVLATTKDRITMWNGSSPVRTFQADASDSSCSQTKTASCEESTTTSCEETTTPCEETPTTPVCEETTAICAETTNSCDIPTPTETTPQPCMDSTPAPAPEASSPCTDDKGDSGSLEVILSLLHSMRIHGAIIMQNLCELETLLLSNSNKESCSGGDCASNLRAVCKDGRCYDPLELSQMEYESKELDDQDDDDDLEEQLNEKELWLNDENSPRAHTSDDHRSRGLEPAKRSETPMELLSRRARVLHENALQLMQPYIKYQPPLAVSNNDDSSASTNLSAEQEPMQNIETAEMLPAQKIYAYRQPFAHFIPNVNAPSHGQQILESWHEHLQACRKMMDAMSKNENELNIPNVAMAAAPFTTAAVLSHDMNTIAADIANPMNSPLKKSHAVATFVSTVLVPKNANTRFVVAPTAAARIVPYTNQIPEAAASAAQQNSSETAVSVTTPVASPGAAQQATASASAVAPAPIVRTSTRATSTSVAAAAPAVSSPKATVVNATGSAESPFVAHYANISANQMDSEELRQFLLAFRQKYQKSARNVAPLTHEKSLNRLSLQSNRT